MLPKMVENTLFLYMYMYNVYTWYTHVLAGLCSVDVELAPYKVLIYSTIRGSTPCAIDFSQRFLVGTLPGRVLCQVL